MKNFVKLFLGVIVIIASFGVVGCGDSGGGNSSTQQDILPTLSIVEKSVYPTGALIDFPFGVSWTLAYTSSVDFYNMRGYVANVTTTDINDAVLVFSVSGGDQGGLYPGKSSGMTVTRISDTKIKCDGKEIDTTGVDFSKPVDFILNAQTAELGEIQRIPLNY